MGMILAIEHISLLYELGMIPSPSVIASLGTFLSGNKQVNIATDMNSILQQPYLVRLQ